jgi:hypothetical protein
MVVASEAIFSSPLPGIRSIPESRIPVVHPLYDDLLHLDRFMMLQVLLLNNQY